MELPVLTSHTIPQAVSVGLELGCEIVLKATKVDGVYDKDPIKFADAKLISEMSLHDAVTNQAIAVMDKAALGLALEQNQPLIVFNSMIDGNIQRVIAGEPIGTHIS